MSLSKLSAQFKQTDTYLVKTYTKSYKPVFNSNLEFLGIVFEERENQWSFIPVGSEVWYEDEQDLIITIDPSRFAKSKSDECVSDMRGKMESSVSKRTSTTRT